LGLDKWITKNLQYLKYEEPTTIQSEVIPLIIKGENVIGISNTGTGKTAAFNLPILNILARDPVGIFAIILEPTRELASQVLEQLKVFTNGFNLRVNMIIGGDDVTSQLCQLDRIPHIIVATPGRLNYMFQQCKDNFKFIVNVKFLVLDEFDQLLNDSILPDVKEIIDYLPKEKQTLFFSATINYSKHINSFFNDLSTFGNKPILVDLTADENIQEKTVKELTQKFLLIPNKTKEIYLYHLMKRVFPGKYTIIFVSNCLRCHFIASLLEMFDLKVSKIHSKIPQKLRFKAIQDFKSRNTSILIATDLASRGLDIPLVDLVINYDVSRNPHDYIHRVGRTARAGNLGVAVSFVTQYDVNLILEIEKVTNKKLEELKVEDEEVLKCLSIVSNASKIVKLNIFESGIEERIQDRKDQTMSRKKAKENQSKINSGK
jgi:ATP-dependent RNA helicase DDX49/DBP8